VGGNRFVCQCMGESILSFLGNEDKALRDI
jgi:hypothetical protein